MQSQCLYLKALNRLRQSTGAAPIRGPADCGKDRTNMRKTYKSALRNMYRRCRKCEGNATKKNENRSPEQSKEDLRVRTQCSKQHLKYIQNVSKIIGNRGPEGSKIRENLALDGSWSFSDVFGAIWSEFWAKSGARCTKLGPRWHQVGSQMVHTGV